MEKKFKIVVNVEEEDFCFSDLRDAIFEGTDNIGNFNILEIKESE